MPLKEISIHVDEVITNNLIDKINELIRTVNRQEAVIQTQQQIISNLTANTLPVVTEVTEIVQRTPLNYYRFNFLPNRYPDPPLDFTVSSSEEEITERNTTPITPVEEESKKCQ